MKAFLGLILFVLFTVSSGVKTMHILIQLTQGEATWYQLAKFNSLNKDKLGIELIKAEVQKPPEFNSENPFTWRKATSCKLQFILDESITEKASLVDMVNGDYWIETKMAAPKPSLQFESQCKLTSKEGIPKTFEGYGTTNNGALLIMSTEIYNKSKELFKGDSKTGFDISINYVPSKSNTKVLEKWSFQPNEDKLTIMVLVSFQDDSEGSQRGSNNPVCLADLTSKCCIMFEVKGVKQYAKGSITVNQKEAKGTVTFDEFPNLQKEADVNTTAAEVKTIEANELKQLNDIRTFTIAARADVQKIDPKKIFSAFEICYPLVVVGIALLQTKLEKGFEFNFGEKGTVEYDGEKKQPVVYFDKPSKSLTFIGKDMLDTFELFRLTSQKANETQARFPGSVNLHKVEMKLFDSKKMHSNISVSDSLSPSSGDPNVFKNKIFQYTYTVL